MNQPNQQPEVQFDALSLDGLEPLLEKAHMELMAAEVPAVIRSESGSETSQILELLTEIANINTLLMGTSRTLGETQGRMRRLQRTLEAQQNHIENQSMRINELETWLDAAIAENERLKRPWWKKLFLFWA